MQHAVITMLVGCLAAGAWAAPQNQNAKAEQSSLAQQLQARFVLARFSGAELKQAGTVLQVQKDGIGAAPGSGAGKLTSSFGSNYKDGKIRRDRLSALVANQIAGLRNLAIGEGVYLLKVQVKESDVVLDVQSCGACNPGSPEPNPVRATVTFPFRKGFVEDTPVDQILATIGEVFSVANTAPAAGPPAGEVTPQAPAPPAAPAVPPAAEPARIELGQTLEQVESILGRPEKVVDLGSKKIYLYPDLKITFVDGRVSDVQ